MILGTHKGEKTFGFPLSSTPLQLFELKALHLQTLTTYLCYNYFIHDLGDNSIYIQLTVA